MPMLQGIPGGEAALQRLYQDVSEPLMNSATSALAGNPFASNTGNDATDACMSAHTIYRMYAKNLASRSQRAGVENAEALPNPWSNVARAASNASSGPAAGAGGGSPFAGKRGSLMK